MRKSIVAVVISALFEVTVFEVTMAPKQSKESSKPDFDVSFLAYVQETGPVGAGALSICGKWYSVAEKSLPSTAAASARVMPNRLASTARR